MLVSRDTTPNTSVLNVRFVIVRATDEGRAGGSFWLGLGFGI